MNGSGRGGFKVAKSKNTSLQIKLSNSTHIKNISEVIEHQKKGAVIRWKAGEQGEQPSDKTNPTAFS